MGDGSVSIAPGSPANVNVATTVDLFVRVRDMCGRPLKGALVVVVGPRQPVKTDDAGLAVFSGISGTSFTVSAQYTAQFGSTPGTPLGSTPRALSITDAFDPSPPGAPDPNARRELHATLLVPVYYPLKHLFGWQNPILRKKVYMDGAITGRYARATDNPKLNRMLRLDGTFDLVDPAKAELDAARANVKQATADVEKEKALLKKDDAALTADNKKLADYDKKVDADKDKANAAGKPLDDAALAKRATEHDRLQKKVDADDATRKKHQDELDARSASLDALTKALDAAVASHGGSTHRQKMEYLVDKVLPKTNLDDWIKYGIIHLTGLRYRASNGCCYPPDVMVYGMREKEIDEREHPSSSAAAADDFAKAQRVFAREYLALCKASPELLKSVAQFYPKQKAGIEKGSKRRKFDATPPAKKTKQTVEQVIVERLELLARSEGPWVVTPPDPAAKSKAKPKPPTELYDLRAIASSFCEAWLKSVGAAGASSSRPQDENELLGEIADRWFNGARIPEVVWKRAMMCTQLLHDFVEDGLNMTPADWNHPKVPDEWALVFKGDGSEWLTHHKKTMQPYVTGVVCNDVASILARARGLPIDDEEYMMGIAKRVSEAGKAAQAQRDKYGGHEDEDDPTNTLPAAWPSAKASKPSFVGLFRPSKLSDLRRGDILFVGHWIPINSDGEDYTIPAHYILDIGPGAPVNDPAKFAPALAAGIKDVGSYNDLVVPGHEVVYGVERNRTRTDGGQTRAANDRLVRAWYRYPKEPKKGEPPLPDPPPPPVAVYEFLAWLHIATVIDVRSSTAICLETAEPVGLIPRSWNEISAPEWFAGRLAPGQAPDLSWFLNRDNLLSKGRLDDG